MNKKGIAPFIIYGIIILLSAGTGFFGYKYYEASKQSVPNEFITGICPEGQNCVSQLWWPDFRDLNARLESKHNGKPIHYVAKISDGTGTISGCFTFDQLLKLQKSGGHIDSIDTKCYYLDAQCQDSSCNAIQPELEQIQKGVVCPAVWEVNGKTVLPDFWCELRVAITDFFRPIQYLLVGIVALIVFFLAVPLARELFQTNKNTTLVWIFSLLISGLVSVLVYQLFWVGMAVLFGYMIVRYAIKRAI